MGSSNTLGFIAIIILLLSSINVSAQDTLTYDYPESGTKIHIAEKLVNFKDGYHYKAVRADYMKAAIDELNIDDEPIEEEQVASSPVDFSSGNYCTMMDVLAMVTDVSIISDLPTEAPTNKSFTEIVSNKYPNLANVTVSDLLDLAENYEYEGVSDILKSVVDLENPTLIDQNLEVGKIQGQASVSPNGSFTYSIPIMLPPGSGGMEPQISLNYNHLAGNGHLGYGWNMSGVSAIRHGNNDYFHDSKTDAGGFDNWVFELDGQRLIWSDLDADGNNVYELESDKYTKVTAYSNDPNFNGMNTFKVVNKSGITSWYGVGTDHIGNSTNSIVSKLDDDDIAGPRQQGLIWFLNKVEDCNGNYMEYTYKNNAEGSEPLLQRIRYTGNNNTTPTATTPYNEVIFVYDARPDINKTYINTKPSLGGKEMLMSERLVRIDVNTYNEQVAKYYLTYCQGWDDAVNYSFLRMIEMKGAQPTGGGIREYVNPTIFNYGINKRHNIATNEVRRATWLKYKKDYTGAISNNYSAPFINYYYDDNGNQQSDNTNINFNNYFEEIRYENFISSALGLGDYNADGRLDVNTKHEIFAENFRVPTILDCNHDGYLNIYDEGCQLGYENAVNTGALICFGGVNFFSNASVINLDSDAFESYLQQHYSGPGFPIENFHPNLTTETINWCLQWHNTYINESDNIKFQASSSDNYNIITHRMNRSVVPANNSLNNNRSSDKISNVLPDDINNLPDASYVIGTDVILPDLYYNLMDPVNRADFNGDGADDLLSYFYSRADNGQWFFGPDFSHTNLDDGFQCDEFVGVSTPNYFNDNDCDLRCAGVINSARIGLSGSNNPVNFISLSVLDGFIPIHNGHFNSSENANFDELETKTNETQGPRLITGDFLGLGKSQLMGVKYDDNVDDFTFKYPKLYMYEVDQAHPAGGIATRVNGSGLPPWNVYLAKQVISLDINGDGKDELLVIRNNDYTSDGGCPQAIHISTQSHEAKIYEFEKDPTTNTIIATEIYSSDSFPTEQHGAIRAGDFNGDGKTDLLTELDGDWKVNYSTGYGFKEEDYTFVFIDYQPWADDDGSLNGHSVAVGDFNGDGKSDIAHHQPGSVTGHTIIKVGDDNSLNIPNNSKKALMIRYSFGYGFDSPTTVIGATSNDPSFMYAGDFNGDGRDDLILDTPDYDDSDDKKMYLNIIAANVQSEALYMQDTRDGLNNVAHTDYQSIAWTENRIYSQVSGIYGDFPFNNVSKPMQVARSLTTTNGLNNNGVLDKNTTNFEYEALMVHRQGMGMLGFKKFISSNADLNIRTELSYNFNHSNHNYLTRDLVSRKTFTADTNEPIETTIYGYDIVDKDGATGGFQYSKLLKSETYTNHLRGGQQQLTEYTYDNPNNPNNPNTNGNTDNLLTKTTTTDRTRVSETYSDYVSSDCSTTPYLPTRVDIVKERLSSSGTVTDSNSEQKGFTYNSNGNLTTSIDYENSFGKVITSYSNYDEFGNPFNIGVDFFNIQESAMWGKSFEENIYDNKGRWVTDTYYWEDLDDNGIYDEALKHSSSTQYDPKWGSPLLSTDKTSSQDISVDYWYNSFGVLLEEKDIFVSSIPQTHISYEYLWDIGDFSTNSNKDINNSIYKVVTDGHRTPKLTTWYDLLGREVKTEQDGYANHTIRSINKYDNRGNVIESTSPFYTTNSPVGDYPEIIARYQSTYDRFNRLETSIDITDVTKTTSLYYNYNPNVFTITSTNPQGESKVVTYDDLNELPSTVTETGVMLSYKYNFEGNIKEVSLLDFTDPSVGLQTLSTTNYDPLGNRREFIDRNAGTTEYKYNAIGELYEQTDARGNVTVSEYDNLGRVKSINRQAANEGLSTYEYYPHGNNGVNQVSKITNYNGVIKQYEYDNFGRLKKETDKIANKTFWKSFSYNPNSALLFRTNYSSGFSLKYHYDNNGFLNKVTNGNETKTIFEDNLGVNEQFIDAYGRYRNYTLGNGLNSEIQYKNGFQYPESFMGGNVFNQGYVFDAPTGNLTYRFDIKHNNSEAFAYDAAPYNEDRLANSVATDNNNGNTYPQTVDYEANGNIKSKSDVGDYVYDPNKIHAVVQVNNIQGNPLVPSLQQDITYNSYQQPLTINEDNKNLKLTYGVDEQRIKTVLKVNNTTNKIKYFLGDFEHLTIKKQCTIAVGGGPNDGQLTVPPIKGKTVKEIYLVPIAGDDLQIAGDDLQIAGGNPAFVDEDRIITISDFLSQCDKEYYIHYVNIDGLNAIIVKDGTQFKYYYTYTDYLGSILTVTDENGVSTTDRSYDAWGRERNFETWNNEDPITAKPEWLYRGYTGHEHLPEFGLINMNGRLYDPLLARMLSPDNFVQDETDPQNYNRYSYVRNNPLKYTDPSGESYMSPDVWYYNLYSGDLVHHEPDPTQDIVYFTHVSPDNHHYLEDLSSHVLDGRWNTLLTHSEFLERDVRNWNYETKKHLIMGETSFSDFNKHYEVLVSGSAEPTTSTFLTGNMFTVMSMGATEIGKEFTTFGKGADLLFSAGSVASAFGGTAINMGNYRNGFMSKPELVLDPMVSVGTTVAGLSGMGVPAVVSSIGWEIGKRFTNGYLIHTYNYQNYIKPLIRSQTVDTETWRKYQTNKFLND